LSRLLGDDGDEWTAELVELVAYLPAEESLPAIREQWHNFNVRDAIVEVLARDPPKEDRAKFLDSLDSFQPSTIELAANALRKIGGEGKPEEITTALQTLRQQCSDRQMVKSRRALAELLQVWTGKSIQVKEPEDGNVLQAYQPWLDWFSKNHPELAAKMTGVGSGADWQKRLAKIEWAAGDAKRGETGFQRFSCAACHGTNSRLGPELKGVAGRLSRDDLFAAIADPNKDVSPLYHTTQVVTSSGKTYRGMMVYESPDGTLIQTGPNTTIRIAGDQIVNAANSRQSIMPTGLLDKASDDQIADLYAYLKTLR
jgi:putative heme-binding domain-containing protein